MIRALIIGLLLTLVRIPGAHADLDTERFGYHVYILRPGINFTVPLTWNNSRNYAYAIGCSGAGSAGVANTSTGTPGGGAALGLKLNVALTPGAILHSGTEFSDCQNSNQTLTYLKNSSSAVAVQADFGTNASGITPGTGGQAANSIGDIVHSGGTTNVSGCTTTLTGRRGSPGAPSDATILADGKGGGCQFGISSGSAGGGAGLGLYGTAGGTASANIGGNGGFGLDGLIGAQGGTGSFQAIPAVDGQGGGGPTSGSFPNASPGSCPTIWVADNGDTAGYCGGASGASGGSSGAPGTCAVPSGGGASGTSAGTPGCLGHDGFIVLVNCPNPVAIADASFCGYPVNTGEAQVVDSNLVAGWPPSTVVTAFLTVTAGGKSLVLGFNAQAGGDNVWISTVGYGFDGRNFCNIQYGSTCGDAFRDASYNGAANPTHGGIQDTCGTEFAPIFLTTTATDADMAEFEESNFFTPNYRWNFHQELCANNQGTIGNVHANGPNGDPNFPNESTEARSGWHHGDHWHDVSALFGGTIPVVRHTSYDIYVDDTPTTQFDDCIGQPPGCVSQDFFTDGSGQLVFDPTKLVLNMTLPGGPTAKPPDYSVFRMNMNTHLDGTVFTNLLFTINGQWQVIPVSGPFQQNMNCSSDPPANLGYVYAPPGSGQVARSPTALPVTCKPDGGLIILSNSPDPNSGMAIGQWKPETGTNCGLNCNHTITISSSGTVAAASSTVQAYRFQKHESDGHHTIPNANIMTAGVWLPGTISPTNLPTAGLTGCTSIPSCRQGAQNQIYLALGTPNQIRTALLGAPGLDSTWRLNDQVRTLLLRHL